MFLAAADGLAIPSPQFQKPAETGLKSQATRGLSRRLIVDLVRSDFGQNH
jgi:hypothetical protein